MDTHTTCRRRYRLRVLVLYTTPKRPTPRCYFTHFRAAVAFLETFEFEEHTAAEDVQRQLRDFAGRAEVHEGGEATVLTDAFALRAALDPLLAVRGSAETGVM